jgi:hypothetical protein
MNPFDSSVPQASSASPDYLPPPPREVTSNFRACWMRAGFLAGLVLGPLMVLWVGQSSSEGLRQLVTQGHHTTGQVVVRG